MALALRRPGPRGAPRRKQGGFINRALIPLLFGGRRWTVQDLFRQSEPGVHFETYDPNTLLRRRNRLTYSSQFSNAAWTRTNILSVTDNADGVGDLVVPSTATGTHLIAQNTVANVGDNVTVTVRAKGGGYSWIRILIGTRSAFFDVTNGALGTVVGATASITAAADAPGYFDCVSTFSPDSIHLSLFVTATDNSTSYAGNGTSGVYLARAQVEWNTTAASEYQEVTDWNTEYMAAALDSIGMWQDADGKVPVTGVEQPVGYWADKKANFLRGPELWNAESVTFSGESSQVSPGVYRIYTSTGAITGVISGSVVSGRIYEVSFTIDSIATLGSGVAVNSTRDPTFTTTGRVHCFITAAITGALIIKRGGTAPMDIQISNVSVREFNYNHATQATSGSRPTLSARYNLLTKTEQYTDAAWTKRGTCTAATTTAPDGTGQLISGLGGIGVNDMFQSLTGLTVGVAMTPSVSVWPISTVGTLVLVNPSNTVNGAWSINLALLTAGAWNRITASHPAVTVTTAFSVSATGGCGHLFYASSGGPLSFYLNGSDLRTANDAALNIPAYQRCNTTSDYETDGFPHYLSGLTDDSYQTPAIDASGCDKVFVCIGQTKRSDAAAAVLLESSASSSANANSIAVFAPASAAANYTVRSKGTTASDASYTNAAVAAPNSAVLTMVGDIAGDSTILRVNGVQVASDTTDQGAGNYGNHVHNLLRRNNASSPADTRVTSVTVRYTTAATSAGLIAQAERYAGRLMGKTL